MVATGDILEIKLGSVYGGVANRGLNVFQYEVQTDETFDLIVSGQDFCNQWYEAITTLLQPITTTIVAWTTVDIVNLSDPLEIWSGQPDDAVSGTDTGDAMPPFVAWSFKLNRGTALTRNGAKRFWGVPELAVTAGQPTAAVALILNTVAAALAAQSGIELDDANVTLTPRIVRKNAAGVMTASQRVISGQFRSVGSQNSRKFGRGM